MDELSTASTSLDFSLNNLFTFTLTPSVSTTTATTTATSLSGSDSTILTSPTMPYTASTISARSTPSIFTATATTATSNTTDNIDFYTTSSSNNMANEDIRQYLERLQDQEFKLFIPAIVFLVILAVAGLVGNVLVLIVYRSKYHRTPTRVFIMAIAIFDLVANVFCIPGEVYDLFHLWNFTNISFCRFSRYTNASTTITSACILLAVSVSRYRKICRPFGRQVTTKQAKILSVCLAIFGMTASIPYGILNGIHTRPTPRPGIVGHECSIADNFVDTIWPLINNGFFLLLFMSLCVPLVVLYCLIGAKAYQHHKLHAVLTGSKKIISTTVSYTHTQTSTTDDSENKPTNRVSKFFNRKYRKYRITDTKSNVHDSKFEEKAEGAKMSRKDNNGTREESWEDNCAGIVPTPGSDDGNKINFPLVHKLTVKLDRIQSQETTSGEENSVGSNSKDMEDSVEGGEDTPNQSKINPIERSQTSPAPAPKDVGIEMVHHKDKASVLVNTNDTKKLSRGIINRTTLMLILITAVYVLSYIPHLTLMFFRFTQPDNFKAMGTASLIAHNLFLRTYFLNSAANPIIYSLCDVNFRRDVLRIFMCCKRDS